jgi:spermidine synthase
LTTSKSPESTAGQAKGLNIGAVGLGVGTLAAYAGPGDTINFYEINPAVIDIAENDKWFSFLTDCRQRGAKCETKLGDARLTMENELHAGQPQHFDLLVHDAFSGDAIPVHLLTEEAFEKIYLPHLAADGTIAIHITNHYVDLEPVVRALAERFGFQTARVYHQRIPGQGIYRTDWMILSRNKALIAALEPYLSSPDKDDKPQPGIGDHSKPAILWTDDRSNLFDVLK